MIYTNPPRVDGFGAQYLSIIFAILYVELYLRSSFALTSPNYKVVYGDEAKDIESIMNLASVYPNVLDLDEPVQRVTDGESYSFSESHIDMCINSSTMQKIRNAFHEKHQHTFNEYRKNIDTSTVNVAVHIRRPSLNPNVDIPQDLDGHEVKNKTIEQIASMNLNPNRYVINERFMNVMNVIRQHYAQQDKKCRFHILSEGNPIDFECFKADDVEFHLNDTVERTFCYLVYADALVLSVSSFSYTAALLNPTNVWFQPFCHRAVSTWHPY